LDIVNIINKVIKGDIPSIKQLFDLHADEMYSTALRLTNDTHTSKDILQESFIKSIENLGQLQNIENYQGWYRRIVINASLKYIKRKFTFDIINEENYQPESEDQYWYRQIPMSSIRDAIQQLPTRSRTIFSLYALENYKHSEIAKELGISVSTSKTQYHYAKKLLKAYLTKAHAL